jgi:hypothetical protein
MSAIVGKAYIENLNHVSCGEIKPIKAGVFYSALEATYGESVTCVASRALLGQAERFSGVKEFKSRISDALINDTEIAPQDQKYIEEYVHRLALTSLSQSKKQ